MTADPGTMNSVLLFYSKESTADPGTENTVHREHCARIGSCYTTLDWINAANGVVMEMYGKLQESIARID